MCGMVSGVLASGKHTKNYEKSPCLMAKSTISTGPFSMSLFVCLPGRESGIAYA